MNRVIQTTKNMAMSDRATRPPILAFLLLFTAMLAVVTALAALNDSLSPAELVPATGQPEPQSQPFHNNRQEKAT